MCPALTSIWKPDTFFYNAVSCSPANDQILSLDPSGSGNVTWMRHQSCNFHSEFDLKAFPFDSQVLDLQRISFGYPSTELVIRQEASKCFAPDPSEDFASSLCPCQPTKACRALSFLILRGLLFIQLLLWPVLFQAQLASRVSGSRLADGLPSDQLVCHQDDRSHVLAGHAFIADVLDRPSLCTCPRWFLRHPCALDRESVVSIMYRPSLLTLRLLRSFQLHRLPGSPQDQLPNTPRWICLAFLLVCNWSCRRIRCREQHSYSENVPCRSRCGD